MVIAAASVVHAELVELAAAAGKPVFCEKPMGMDLAEVDRAISAAERAGVALQVGFNRRFDRGFQAAHRAVVDGRARRHPAAPLADPRPGAGESGRCTAVDDLHPDPDPRLRHAQLAEPRGRAGRGVRHGRRPDRSRVRGRRAAGHRRGGDHLRQRRPRGRRGELLGRLRLRRPRRGVRLPGHGDRRATAPGPAPGSSPRPARRTRPPAATPSCCGTPTSGSSSSSPPRSARAGRRRSPARDAHRALAIAMACIDSVRPTHRRPWPAGPPQTWSVPDEARTACRSAPRWCSPNCPCSSGSSGSTRPGSGWRSGTGAPRTSTP